MPDQTMIERVARELCEATGKVPSDFHSFPGGGMAQNWVMFETMARAAIASMREPTEGMCKAAFASTWLGELPADIDADSFGDIWRAGIDSALSERREKGNG